jgi:long-subunit acyl-CoA synthetase (AMP-forming)
MFTLFSQKNCAGENVEPTEIEEAMSQSTLIQQIVVLGQVYLYPSFGPY